MDNVSPSSRSSREELLELAFITAVQGYLSRVSKTSNPALDPEKKGVKRSRPVNK